MPGWSSPAGASSSVIRRWAPLWWTCAHLLTATDPRTPGARVDRRAVRRSDRGSARRRAARRRDRRHRRMPRRPSRMRCAAAATFGSSSSATITGASSGRRRLDRADVDHRARTVRRGPVAHAARSTSSLVEAEAVGGGRALVEMGGGVLAAVAQATNRPVWFVAGRGRHLPAAYVEAMVARRPARRRRSAVGRCPRRLRRRPVRDPGRGAGAGHGAGRRR